MKCLKDSLCVFEKSHYGPCEDSLGVRLSPMRTLSDLLTDDAEPVPGKRAPFPLRTVNLLPAQPDWRLRLLNARAAFRLTMKLDEVVTDALAHLAARTTALPICDECAQRGEPCREHRALAERMGEELAQLDASFASLWTRLEDLAKSLPPVEGKKEVGRTCNNAFHLHTKVLYCTLPHGHESAHHCDSQGWA